MTDVSFWAAINLCAVTALVWLTLVISVKSLPDDKILDRSNFKQSADNNFKFDENSRKSSKQVENTVGKGEIARYEQFLLFPQCS